MNKEIKADDVIFNFFQQICDEKDDLNVLSLVIAGSMRWKPISPT